MRSPADRSSTAVGELRTVLLIAHECRPFNDPGHTVGAQRPYELARWLPEWGWRAEVLCHPHVDGAVPITVGRGGASRIVPVPGLVPPGHLAWIHVAAAGRGRVGKAVASAATLALLPRGDWSRRWRPCAARAAIERIEAGRSGVHPPVDVVVGEYGPDAGLWAARDAARATGVPWVGDFRDPWGLGFPPGRRVLPFRYYGRAMSGVAAVVDVSKPWSEHNRRLTGASAFVVPNGYDPDDVPAPSAIGRRRDDVFRIVVSGSLAADHPLALLARALIRLGHETGPAIVLEYRGYQPALFESMLAGARSDRVAVFASAPVPRAHHLTDAARAAVLVVPSAGGSDDPDPLLRAGKVPARLLELLPLGVPLLMVPGDGGLADAVLAETRAGVVCRTIDDVASTLEEWSRAQGAGLTYGPEPDRAEIERYSRRTLAGRFAAVLDEVVNRG